jgi:DNA-binding CsgD family transcriptional regulator
MRNRDTSLSPRQREIRSMLIDGLNMREIAERLGISTRTVEFHCANMYRKRGVKNAVSLVADALRGDSVNERNCPFYGRHFVWWGSVEVNGQRLNPFNLLASASSRNQCAIVFGAQGPCYLEAESRPVDWRECKRVEECRIG